MNSDENALTMRTSAAVYHFIFLIASITRKRKYLLTNFFAGEKEKKKGGGGSLSSFGKVRDRVQSMERNWLPCF